MPSSSQVVGGAKSRNQGQKSINGVGVARDRASASYNIKIS